MDEYCAPQWTDFKSSPQLVMDDFFEREHKVHERQMHSMNSGSDLKGPATTDLGMIDGTCHNNKSLTIETEGLHSISHIERKSELHEVVAVQSNCETSTTLTSTELQVQIASNLVASEETCNENQSIPNGKCTGKVENFKTFDNDGNTDSVTSVLNESNAHINIENTEVIEGKNDIDAHRNVESENVVDARNDYKSSRVYSKNNNRNRTLSENVTPLHVSRTKIAVSTCKYNTKRHIFSTYTPHRKTFNTYISLAEAVRKFHIKTPQRYHTTSNKQVKLDPIEKRKQNWLKTTIANSPVLMTKTRIRSVTVLSQEEREKLQVEEIMKHRIKANPVRHNILKNAPVLKQPIKRPITVQKPFHLTEPKKTVNVSAASKNEKPDALNIAAEKSIKLDKNKPKYIHLASSNFEVRNKEFQVKKEQKLKELQIQQMNKIKTEFHAKPAPSFSETPSVSKIKQNTKQPVCLTTYNFEERNRQRIEKKNFAKHTLEEADKITRVFHANPMPTFKHVPLKKTTHKVNQSAKKEISDKPNIEVEQILKVNKKDHKDSVNVKSTKDHIDGHNEFSTKKNNNCYEEIVEQENKEPNIQIINVASSNCLKNKNSKEIKVYHVPELKELNTDKRSKDRHRFNEKIKEKQMEKDERHRLDEERRLQIERKELAELRRLAETKGRPMPVYKTPVLKKCTKPLTNPQSPAWASKTTTK